MREFANEIDAHSLAFRLALKNTSAWLEIAKSAMERGHYGQSYSVAITAYEEIGKAFVSWLTAMNFISLDEEIIDLVYYKHEMKTFVSDLISIQDALHLALATGIIEGEDILKELSLTSEDEQLLALETITFEREERRKHGMYVDIWEEESKGFSVTSPFDFSEERSRDAIEEVQRTYEIVELLIKLTDEHPPLIDYLRRVYEEQRRTGEGH